MKRIRETTSGLEDVGVVGFVVVVVDWIVMDGYSWIDWTVGGHRRVLRKQTWADILF